MNNFSSVATLVFELDKYIVLQMNDKRQVFGILRSFDQYCNLVLEQSAERKYVDDKYCDIPLGVQIIRGDEICILGEIDPEELMKPIPGMTRTTIEGLLGGDEEEPNESEETKTEQ
ncbi:hypothetical protein WA158_002383 [Blastocystis sp. Blastoise]